MFASKNFFIAAGIKLLTSVEYLIVAGGGGGSSRIGAGGGAGGLKTGTVAVTVQAYTITVGAGGAGGAVGGNSGTNGSNS